MKLCSQCIVALLFAAAVQVGTVRNARGAPATQPEETAPSQAPVEQNPNWFLCEEDSDCAAIDGPCKVQTPLNIRFRKEYGEWLKSARDAVKCSVAPSTVKSEQEPIVAYCRDGQCAMRETLEAQAEEAAEAAESPAPGKAQ